jgi:hypothetical protein
MYRRGVLNLGLVLAIGAIAAYGVVAIVYMPLTQGSSSGDTTFAGDRFLRLETDPFGSGSLWVYCPTPPGDFAWMVSVRNDGPLPITLLGLGDGPVALGNGEDGPGIRDLAAYRVAEPLDTPLTSHGTRDPRKAPTLAPIDIAAGAEFEVWVRWWTGAVPWADGTGRVTRSIPLRYRILGIERSADVTMRDGVGFVAPCTKK